MNTAVRFTLVLVTLVGGILTPAAPSAAHNVVTGNQNFSDCVDVSPGYVPCIADNATHYYLKEGLGPMTSYGVEQTLWNAYDTTDLNVENEPVGHTTTTDAVYLFDNTLSNSEGILGEYRCIYDAAGFKCDHAHIAFNGDFLQELGWNVDTPQNRQNLWSLACHETGHSVGLTHGDNADPTMNPNDSALNCMRTPFSGSYAVGSHNVPHVNANH